MGGRLDLEAVQARFDRAAAHRFSGPSRYTDEHVADLAASAGDVPRLVEELGVARTFRDETAAALAPGRWRGFDGPDGVDVLEVIGDVAQALERHDQATGRPDPTAGHAASEGPP